MYPLRRYPYVEVVEGLALTEDPESYTGGSIATGRGSHAGQVKGDDPDKKRYSGPPSWGLDVGMTTPTCKTCIYLETSTKASEEGRLGRPWPKSGPKRHRRRRNCISPFGDQRIRIVPTLMRVVIGK
jgi:hypothetical protein